MKTPAKPAKNPLSQGASFKIDTAAFKSQMKKDSDYRINDLVYVGTSAFLNGEALSGPMIVFLTDMKILVPAGEETLLLS